jgi:hypothetical protein
MATIRKTTGPRVQGGMYFQPQINWIRRNPAFAAWLVILGIAN